MADAIMARRGKPKINYAKDWQYTTNDTATLVTKYIGTKTSVIVPNKIEGKPVVLQNSSNDTTGVFTNNRNIKSVKFSEGVSIANNNMYYMFCNCTSLVNVLAIPANVTNMRCTFISCSNLVNAPVIPANVTDMYCTFEDCYSLVNAPVIPANVTNIVETFYNCGSLVNAPVIPANVTNVASTFYNCTNLVNAPVIPANVTSMSFTFSNCTNLTGNIKITSNRINNTSMANCFRNTSLTKNVYIPFTGYNATANTHNAAINSTYGINGKNGVTIYDINTYTG